MMQNYITVFHHNLLFIIESVFAWFLVGFAHIVGLTVETTFVAELLPYIQLAVYALAGATSVFTMYKIHMDLKKKK